MIRSVSEALMPRLAAALALLVGCTPALWSQSTSASLTGYVTDPSHARIADARVVAISAGTSVSDVTTTNASGEYYFSSLAPGTYRIEVEKAGFKKLIRPGDVLHEQDALEIDFELTVGPATESVTVEGGAPLVNTESATVSTVIDRNFADNLPLNGRSFQMLIALTPGVVVTPTAYDDQGQFSVNGQRADGNYFTIDGASANFGVTGYVPLVQAASGALPAFSVSGGTNSLVSVDAMQEFRVQTSSFAPEFGRTPGGQISIVTRSGTNSFHGTAFDYFRNDVLDANNWFNGYTNNPPLPKAEERQNDFGGVFGGPIIRDKTFFFFSYEGLRLRQPFTQQSVVPDSASRQQAPASMQPFLNAFSVQNGPDLGSGLAQFDASYSNPTSLDATSIRVDRALNSRLSFFGRYDYSPSATSTRNPFGALSSSKLLSATIQTFTAGSTQQITPLLSNDARANYSNDRAKTRYVMDGFGGAKPLPDSEMFPAGFSSMNSLFELYVGGTGEYAQGRSGTDEQRQINLVDNVSVTKGSHQVKLGVDYRWLSPFSSPFAYAQFAEFTGVTSSPGGALSGEASFADAKTSQNDAMLIQNFSLYGQDTWKITQRLTATYGLRWDLNPPLRGKNLANQPFTVSGLNDPTTIALAPRGTPLYQTTYGNVAPRIGVDYQLHGGTGQVSVLRGGFGVFYDLGSDPLGGASSYFPFIAESTFSPVAFPLSPQNAAPPVLTTSPPASVIEVAEPNLKLPRTYEWNAALEQSLGANDSFSLTYIGAIGRDLLRVTVLAESNANFPFIGLTDNSATSNYQALQAKFERRLSRGLQVLASYSWSHSIDISSTDAFSNYLNTPTSFANPSVDRGDSDFDIRSSFSTGVTYSLPSPQLDKVFHAVLGGWSLDSFILARSAPPVDLIGALFEANGTELYPRPNVVPGMPQVIYGSQYPGGKIFNKAAFTPSPAGQQGDYGRNVLRGFGAFQGDLAAQRQFDLVERLKLKFRCEFFNILNHPNFGPPTNSLTSPLFGYSTETLASSLGSGGANGGFSPLYQIGGPRSIQFAAKLQF
jgi:hypothetical protein